MFNESSKGWDFFFVLDDGDSFFNDPFFDGNKVGALEDIGKEFNF
jgi:hypothetical protein